ncbi:outer membrane beta-barrel protein [Mucilaginibacter sp. Bleaf8]|uniref:outer membrane beta-barrel protein n=1 Tax=Mucilaginibacter sp. Bleaf8 TaxID=2834430 RepID=UPI001BCE44E9|nr:outer membrane beta-barrel protein [Mucilaginibacter sp. Bleaf8]MBS7566559.1 outer membrane beta-barrel protein [Mucilaginibacter sp. Bleaf8]
MDEYITYTGPVTMDKSTFPDLSVGVDTTVMQDTVFLKLAYRGKPVTVLTYQDKIKYRIFLQEGNSQPFEIKYYHFYAGSDKEAVREYSPYTVTLNQLATKYNPTNKSLRASIDRGRYTETSIVNIVKQINNDKNVIQTKMGGSRFFAGLTFARISNEIDGDNIFSGQKSANFFPSINAGIDLFLNRHTQKLIFRGELSFYNSSANYDAISDDVMYFKYHLKQATFSLKPQVLYNIYNKENLQLYLNIGASFNYSFYSKNQHTYQFYSISTINDNYYGLNNLWVSLPVQVGTIINKKFEIYALYTSPTAFTSQASFSIAQSIYGIGAHYYFK